MAPLDYKSSLSRYRRYLQSVQNQPLWKASLYLVLSLTLVIILVAAALRPTLVTIASLLGQIRQQEDISEQLNRKINAVSSAQQQLSAAAEKLVFLDNALPVEARINEWNNSLTNAASQSSVAIDSISITEVSIKESSRSAEMKFMISASGQYAGLKQFLQIVESLRRLVTIEMVSFSKSETLENSSTVLEIEGVLGRGL